MFSRSQVIQGGQSYKGSALVGRQGRRLPAPSSFPTPTCSTAMSLAQSIPLSGRSNQNTTPVNPSQGVPAEPRLQGLLGTTSQP